MRTTHNTYLYTQRVYVHIHMHAGDKKLTERFTTDQQRELNRVQHCRDIYSLYMLYVHVHVYVHVYVEYVNKYIACISTCTCTYMYMYMCIYMYYTCNSFTVTVWLLQRILGRKLRSLVTPFSLFFFSALQRFSLSRTLHGIR